MTKVIKNLSHHIIFPTFYPINKISKYKDYSQKTLPVFSKPEKPRGPLCFSHTVLLQPQPRNYLIISTPYFN